MRYILIFLALVFNGCESWGPRRSTPQELADDRHTQMADQITKRIAKKIQTETGLILMGLGGGTMGSVRSLYMGFQCFQSITIEQARELLVYCANEYLNAINENEEIRPHLANYPFTTHNVKFNIFIYKNNRYESDTGALSVAKLGDGKLRYNIDSESPIKIFDTVLEETYEEAVKIVEKTKLIDIAPTSLLKEKPKIAVK